MKRVFTAEEKLSRWEDTREIKNLVGRRRSAGKTVKSNFLEQA